MLLIIRSKVPNTARLCIRIYKDRHSIAIIKLAGTVIKLLGTGHCLWSSFMCIQRLLWIPGAYQVIFHLLDTSLHCNILNYVWDCPGWKVSCQAALSGCCLEDRGENNPIFCRTQETTQIFFWSPSYRYPQCGMKEEQVLVLQTYLCCIDYQLAEAVNLYWIWDSWNFVLLYFVKDLFAYQTF